MSIPIIATKLYIPPPRAKVVSRPHLNERLNEGLHRKLTLISAAAGFGKTTLVSEWVAHSGTPTAWLSLDEEDSDLLRFLTYFIAALQTLVSSGNQESTMSKVGGMDADFGHGLVAALQAPQPPSIEFILTTLLNEIDTIPDHFALVLDDYHSIDSQAIDNALTFLLDHLPPQMHLVIATRQDPQLPLAQLRVRDQLTELRIADLRFTNAEAAGFLNRVMGLNLSAQDIAALEARTEGWIAGLQLAAISLQGIRASQGQKESTGFIKSFTGSHHFVMDYLVEQVLKQQPGNIQTFLLYTSILDRLCAPLCDAVLLDPAALGPETLAYLERANLFMIPLDNERRWYRYHHLFADLLRQRLSQNASVEQVSELHIRASAWYEANGLELEAFQHAVAANDIERAERLIDGPGIPRHFRGAVSILLNWLESLPTSVMNERPLLWWRYGSLLLVSGQTSGVEEKLRLAEAAIQSKGVPNAELDDKTRNLIGQIAAARATVALTQYRVDVMRAQAHRALEYLPPGNPSFRATANWSLGFAYLLQGDRAAAARAYTEAIALAKQVGDTFTTILATIGLGNVYEGENELQEAAQCFRQVLELAGDQPLQIICEAHIGLARVLYQWNDLAGAERHGQQSLYLARQYEQVIDRFIISEVFFALLKFVRGDVDGAEAMLAETSQTAQRRNFVHRIPEVAAAQILVLIAQGKLSAAAQLAETHKLPLSQARVYFAQGNASAALAVLEPLRRQFEARGLADERLKVLVLESLALSQHGDMNAAVKTMGNALRLAEPGGYIRLFVDEGAPMSQLISRLAGRGGMPTYVANLQAAFEADKQARQTQALAISSPPPEPLLESLSQRELQVLQLVAQGLSNREISERLVLALITVKGHNQKIFDKLHVHRRTEAVARARELGLL